MTQYQDLDAAVKLLSKIGTDAKIGKADLEHAYHQVPIHPNFWHLLIFKTKCPFTKKEYYFVDKCLPFGSGESCQIYQRVSNALAFAVSKQMGKPLVNYVDDFLFANKLMTACNSQLDTFFRVCEFVGFPVSKEKIEWSEEFKIVLGLLLHRHLQHIALPADKIHKAQNFINYFLLHRRATVKQFMSLAGHLNFLTRAVSFGRPFLHRIYSTIVLGQNHLGRHLTISPEVKEDFRMWGAFLETEPYYRKFIEHLEVPFPAAQWYTDASGSANLGFGCYLNGEWMCGHWPPGFIQPNNATSTCFLELFAMVVSIEKWAPRFKNQRVRIFCDNQAAVQVFEQLHLEVSTLHDSGEEICGNLYELECQIQSSIYCHRRQWYCRQPFMFPIWMFFLVGSWSTDTTSLSFYISMASATKTALKFAEQGVTEKTRSSYVRHYQKFVEFLRRVQPTPTNWEDSLLLFRGHLISEGKSSHTIASYMTGICSRLRLDGVDLRENEYLMKQLHRAAKKKDSERIRCPVTKNLLNQILKRVDLATANDFKASLFKAIFAVAYEGLFRIGELVESEHALKATCVMQAADGEELNCVQHSSKVLQKGDPPVVVHIPTSAGVFCPCSLMTEFAWQ